MLPTQSTSFVGSIIRTKRSLTAWGKRKLYTICRWNTHTSSFSVANSSIATGRLITIIFHYPERWVHRKMLLKSSGFLMPFRHRIRLSMEVCRKCKLLEFCIVLLIYNIVVTFFLYIFFKMMYKIIHLYMSCLEHCAHYLI